MNLEPLEPLPPEIDPDALLRALTADLGLDAPTPPPTDRPAAPPPAVAARVGTPAPPISAR